MSAAPPGIISLTAMRSDGTVITATIRFDLVDRTLTDPAVVIDGTGQAALRLRTAVGAAGITVQAGDDPTAADLASCGAVKSATSPPAPCRPTSRRERGPRTDRSGRPRRRAWCRAGTWQSVTGVGQQRRHREHRTGLDRQTERHRWARRLNRRKIV